MRKNNTLIGILTAATVALAVCNLFFVWTMFHFRKVAGPLSQHYNELSQTIAKMNRNIIIVQRLGIDALQYAAAHPELQRVLQQHVPLLQQLHLIRPGGQIEGSVH